MLYIATRKTFRVSSNIGNFTCIPVIMAAQGICIVLVCYRVTNIVQGTQNCVNNSSPGTCRCYNNVKNKQLHVECECLVRFPNLPHDTAVLQILNSVLPHIIADNFAKTPKITYLCMEACQCQIIDDDAFDEVPYLETLILRKNFIRHVPVAAARLRKLAILDMNENYIRTLNITDNFTTGIRSFRMVFDKNPIHKLNDNDLEGYSKFIKPELSLESVPLTEVSKNVFKPILKFSKINFRNTHIGTLTSHKRKLFDIFQGISVEELTLSAIKPNLPILNASILQPLASSNVTGMSLASNNIIIIQSGAFDHMQWLQILKLDMNDISIVEQGAFRKLTHLKYITIVIQIIIIMTS